MKRNNTYERIINQKLNGLTAPDVTGLWDNMEAILDKEMPQQEKKHRIGGWMNANLLIAASLFLAVGSVYTLCQVSGKAPAAVAKASVANLAADAVTEASTIKADAGNANGVATSTFVSNQASSTIASAKAGLTKNGSAVQKNTLSASEKESNGAALISPVLGEASVDNNSVDIAASNKAALAEAAIAEDAVITTNALEEVALVAAPVPAVFGQQPALSAAVSLSNSIAGKKKKEVVFADKGFSAGLSVNLPFAINSQAKNELDTKGSQNKWQDYLPAVYAQWHLSKKLYVQAEFQPVAAQYTPNFTLYNRVDVLNPDEKEQKVVKLNKLFYQSLPLSVHYKTPIKNVTVGVGVQYAKLTKVILQDQEYYHLIQAGGVFKVEERKNEVAVKDPEAVRQHNTGDVVDSVASAIRTEDWRLMADVGYQYKGFNLGVRYTNGMRNYINSNFTNLAVKDRNASLQVYLRFNLFDSRKK